LVANCLFLGIPTLLVRGIAALETKIQSLTGKAEQIGDKPQGTIHKVLSQPDNPGGNPSRPSARNVDFAMKNRSCSFFSIFSLPSIFRTEPQRKAKSRNGCFRIG
jgi:hypothetical protein